MNEHELRTIIKRLFEIIQAIRKDIHSINGHHNTQEHQQHPPSQSDINAHVSLPVAVHDYYAAENREGPHKANRDRVRLLVEGATLVAAIVAAFFAFRSFGEVRKQANAATDQGKIMRAAQSPWLGLNEQIRLTEPPTFRFFNPERVNVNLVGTGVIKNFGTSPAFDANGMVVVQIPSPTDTVTRPDKKWMMCPEGPTIQHRGEIVFPGSGFIQGFNQQTSVAIAQHPEIGRIWLLGCVVYHDEDQNVHHTWFWLRSNHPDNASWINDSPVFRHMPITGFESWGEEAN